NRHKEPVFVLSTGAWKSLSLFQQQTMLSHTQVIHSDLTLTEQLGGGSARCMLAELY
ncbi:MAG: arginine deiminase-related protein, partial [Bacteroidota bacterium]